jgi:hypothetical protein
MKALLLKLWLFLKSLPGKVWRWILSVKWLNVLDSEAFLYTFPIAVFAVVTLAIHSYLMLATTALWLFVIVRRISGKSDTSIS